MAFWRGDGKGRNDAKALLSRAVGGGCVAIAAMLPLGCGNVPAERPDVHRQMPDALQVELRVLDTRGDPIGEARVQLGNEERLTDSGGRVRLHLQGGPDVALVEASGHITEPVPIGWESHQRRLDVALLDAAPGRIAIHFGGDAMMGRRYEAPHSGEPLIPPHARGAGARHVVEPMRAAFSAADFRVFNLETVVSTLGDEEAYPGKRFLLNCHPETLEAVLALRTDLLIFANNHTRDWLDLGVARTLEALEDVAVPAVGGGLSAEQAVQPVVLEAQGVRIGTLAYTSVNGSFVNDNYPTSDVPRPSNVPDKDEWLYEERAYSYESDEWTLPEGNYRIGDVWRAFSDAESSLSEEVIADAWAHMSETFPELQDWVARRGHGGAAMWDRPAAQAQIEQLRPDVDLLVVQMHSGFQFLHAASAALASAARSAIDAGADMVIAHHPHVLQGIEWYKGKLIVYSLGNFIFDQDFLSTFPSGFVRVIWEGSSLVQARFVPLALVGYRPMPVTDRTANNVLRTVWERSLLEARAERTAGGVVPLWHEKDEDTAPAQLRFEWNTARIVAEPQPDSLEVRAPRGQVVELPSDVLVNGHIAAAEADELFIGRDVFGWGHFDDDLADGEQGGAAQWVLDFEDKRLRIAAAGQRYMQLSRTDRNMSRLMLRTVARIPLSSHRLYELNGSRPSPLDPSATYDLQFRARREGRAEPFVRFDVYDFDDTNPTEDPTSVLLARTEFPVLPTSGKWDRNQWQTVSIPFIPQELTNSPHANMVMTYIILDVPDEGESSLEVDDVALIEWRDASKMPPMWGAYTHLKNLGDTTRAVPLSILSAAP